MKNRASLFSKLLGLCIASFGFLSHTSAQIPWATDYFPRHGRFEVYGAGQFLHQEDTKYSDGSGGTTRLRLEDTGLGGVGMGYHFNDFLALRGQFMFGPATFRFKYADGTSSPYGENAYINTGRINLDYNIINRRLTPFITAGIGYQYQEVELNSFDSDHHHHDYDYETDFTWNVGAGLRWDIAHHVFIKAMGGAQWLDYQHSKNVTAQIEATFSVGFIFP